MSSSPAPDHTDLAAEPPAAPSGPPRLLDAAQAGELLHVPPSWVLAEARADRIPHLRLGRYVRFDADELHAWCRARLRGPRRSQPPGRKAP